MAKFKVGDEIIGNDKHRYGYTKLGWVGKVVQLIEDKGINDIIVSNTPGTSYPVQSKYFDLFKSTSPVEEELEVYQIF